MSQVNSRKAFFEKLEQKKGINQSSTSGYGTAVPTKKEFKPKSKNRVPPPPAQKRAPPPPRTNLNVAKSSQGAQAQQLWDSKTADFPAVPQKGYKSHNGYDNNFQAAEESPYSGVNVNLQNKSEQHLPIDWDFARKVWVTVQVFNTFYILSLGFAITTYSATKPKNHLFDGPHRTMFTMTVAFVMLQSFYNFGLIFQQVPRTELSLAWVNGHGMMVTLIVIMMTIHNCTFLKHEGPAYNVAVGCTNIPAQLAMMYVMSGYKCGKNTGYEHYYD